MAKSYPRECRWYPLMAESLADTLRYRAVQAFQAQDYESYPKRCLTPFWGHFFWLLLHSRPSGFTLGYA